MARRAKGQQDVLPPAPEAPSPPTVGSSPLLPVNLADLSQEERIQVQHFTAALKRSNYPAHLRQESDNEELEIRRMTSFVGATGSGPTGSLSVNDRFSKRHTVADMNIPRNPVAMIQLSQRYANENPFVAKGIRVKTNFTLKDFRHQSKCQESVDFYDEAAINLNLWSQLQKIETNLYSVGVAPIYWGGESQDGSRTEGQLKYMQVIDPTAVHVQDIMGRKKLWLKITPVMIAAVRDPLGKVHPMNRVQYQSMPQYWIEQIKERVGKADAMIELAEGSYAVVENRYVSYNTAAGTLDGIPLQGAFDALQRYRLLAAGDFAVAWNVKNMLTLISEGDPKTDTKNYKPADSVRLAKLQAQFSQPDYALTIYCDPTTQVRYVIPPLEVFDPIKYKQVEKEIKDTLNLPSFMWNNDGGGSFGAAMQEVQLLRQEVETLRLILRVQFFRRLYSRLRKVISRPKFSE